MQALRERKAVFLLAADAELAAFAVVAYSEINSAPAFDRFSIFRPYIRIMVTRHGGNRPGVGESAGATCLRTLAHEPVAARRDSGLGDVKDKWRLTFTTSDAQTSRPACRVRGVRRVLAGTV